MKIGVLVFPGSNCDHDAYHVLKHVCGQETRFVWHKDSDLSDLDAVVVPGGFSYGDYLRTGAIARFSPVMTALGAFAKRGGPVLGICNGFQILQEAGLLPGAMLRNRGVKFLSQPVHIRVEADDTIATAGIEVGAVLTMPNAHGEGNFYADPEEMSRLEGEGQVVFRYTTRDGRLDAEANVNGSASAVAGVCNRQRNVVGLMPHPERAAERSLGSTDGRQLFEALAAFLARDGRRIPTTFTEARS
jgi:phosphoribosylformylglycinamidine synthase I